MERPIDDQGDIAIDLSVCRHREETHMRQCASAAITSVDKNLASMIVLNMYMY